MEREEALDKYKWDLTDIYESQEEWEKDYNELMNNVGKYESYKGKLNNEETLKEYFEFNEWYSRKFMNLIMYLLILQKFFNFPSSYILNSSRTRVSIISFFSSLINSVGA